MTEFIQGDIQTLLESVPKMTALYTAYEYDQKDRQIKTILPDGFIQFAEFEIKDNNSICYSTDPLGNVFVQETDSRGNIVRVAKKDQEGNLLTKVTYEYNAMGEMLKAFDAKQNPITVEYDLLGRRTALESLDSGRQEFFYDECSNLVRENNSVLLENNKQINYEYDGLNRIVKIDYPDTEDTVYTYGGANAPGQAAGKILKVQDASGTLKYEYGKLGEVTKETRTLRTHLNGYYPTETAVMEYRSDYLGRMQWITYPDGEKVTYGYDRGGQVISVTGENFGQSFEYVKDIGYDEYGQRVYIEYGNGVKTEYEYNPERRWLNKIKTSKDSNVYQNIKYEFDKVGNVNGYINDWLTASNGNYITKQEYEYDELNQLTKVTGYTESNKYKLQTPDLLSEYTQEFKFDSIGNMTQKKSIEWVKYNRKVGDDLNYNTLEYTIMPGYAHRVQNIGDRYFEYDAAGNIIVEQDGKIDLEDSSKYYKIEQIDENKYIADSAWGYYTDEDRENKKTKVYRRTYEWDDKNQLIKSQDDNVTVCYTYGSDGQRASKYTENSETLYTNDFWVFHVSGSVRNGAGIINKNIYLGKMRVVTKVKEAFDAMEITERQCQYFYHSDHLGSAQLVTDNKGNEYQRIEYTPYGETWIDLKATQNDLVKLNYKFTAKELDEETGLYYYGARYLNPKYSMWISTDPALGEYIPQAPINDEIRRNNQNLPGMGGIFNHINSNLYHYAGNNPIRYTDPDGRDIIILNRSYGAKGFGHNAILIGNDKDGWIYFSKDGNNPVNGTYNSETGYRANSKDSFKDQKNIDRNNEKSKYATLYDFIKENKKRNRDDQYDHGLRIITTSKDDKKLIEQGDQLYKNPYSLRAGKKGQNCGDLVGDIVINAEIDAKGNKKGTLGFTIPNMQYKQFKRDNSKSQEINVLRTSDEN